MASERELIALLSDVPEKHRRELRGFLAFSSRKNGRAAPSETEEELLATLSQLFQRVSAPQ